MTAADTIRDAVVSVKRCPDCGARFGIDAAFCPFDGTALGSGSWDPSRDALVGTVIEKRYEVHEPLGEGGMGTVYKVRHVTLNRMFAMKVLRKDLAADAALAQRFVQEAKATAAIKHAGVVAINDFGVLDDGLPYFVMELLVGETLSARIRGRGPLAPRDAIAVAKRIAAALDASHAAGVIHRDLKPENVFLVGKASGKGAAEEEVRIVDFGAAKVIGGSKLTRPGVVFGTPYYMSPEQASGQSVDPRADVYSLGVLMYEMITGAVPFEADTYMGVLTKHMFVAPAKPSEKVAAGIQLGELEGVVMKALEKEPGSRYASMRELVAALDDAMAKRASGRPAALTQKRTARMPDAPRVSTADAIERSVKHRVALEEKHRKNKLVVIGVVATAFTVVTGAVVLQMFGPKPSDLPPPRASAAPEPAASSAAVVAPSASAAASATASASASSTPSSSAAASASARPAQTSAVAQPPTKPRPPASIRPGGPPAYCARLSAEEKLAHDECMRW